MTMQVDLGQILVVACFGLIGVVWTMLKNDIRRIELSSERIGAQNTGRIDNINAHLDKIAGDLKHQIGAIQLQMVGSYPTKDELQRAFNDKTERLSDIERSVEKLSRDVERLLARLEIDDLPPRQRAKNG